MQSCSLNIAYSQICVFQQCLKNPFNEWRDEYLAQGFSWRFGSVSFATIEPDGPARVEVFSRVPFDLEARAQRVIRVPFEVPTDGKVQIASIGDEITLELACGIYSVTFAHGVDDGQEMWCRFVFEETKTPIFAKILKTDGQIDGNRPLLMNAKPA